jgi:hypothetical protein
MACIYPELEMKILVYLRVLLLGSASTTALLGQVDAREIIRHAVAADERNWRIARNYTFLQRVELRRLDAQGRVKLSEVQTYDVTLQEGTPYRQLVQRDDRPLAPAEEKREQESLAKSIAERRQETEAERAKRVSASERRPVWQREAWHELAEAFEFRLVGEGSLDGHSIFLIEAMPRQGYQPRSSTAKLFRSLKCRFWVDQQDHQIVKVEAEVIDTMSVGLFLVRVAKGSRATLELTCVSDGVWLPDRLQVFASARLGLLQVLHIEQRVHYSRYSSVPADARTIDQAGDHRSQGGPQAGDDIWSRDQVWSQLEPPSNMQWPSRRRRRGKTGWSRLWRATIRSQQLEARTPSMNGLVPQFGDKGVPCGKSREQELSARLSSMPEQSPQGGRMESSAPSSVAITPSPITAATYSSAVELLCSSSLPMEPSLPTPATARADSPAMDGRPPMRN